MAQNERIQNYAKAHGWKIEKKYSDRKQDADEDTAFLEMRADGIARKFDCVVIDSMYLCGRKALLAIDLFSQVFLPAGIHFAVVEDNVASSKMSQEDAAAYLKDWSTNRNKRASAADIVRRSEKRQYPKYGYLYNGDRMELVVDEEAAPVIRELFRLAAAGKGMTEISRMMNERKIEPPYIHMQRMGFSLIWQTGNSWRFDDVKSILQNRLYIGEWSRTVGGEKVTVPCPAIIDSDLFQTVNGQRKKRKKYLQTCERCMDLFAGKITDRDTGNKLILYNHYPLHMQAYRMLYSKMPETEYEKMWIPFADVGRQVMEQLLAESEKAKKVIRVLESEIGLSEKEKQCRDVRSEAQAIFEKMLFLEAGRCSKREAVSKEDSPDADDVEQKFYALDQELRKAELRMKEIEKTFSSRNPWVELYAGFDPNQELTRKSVRKYIDRIECTRFESVEVFFQEQEWFQKLPGDWFEEEDL